jgi:2-polyprenyl-3-methyl-5-hydroxy-6-metoxy-1,4-benzoquinol methylase
LKEPCAIPRPLDIPEDGIYARNQIYSKSRLVSFSHRRRFQVGVDLVAPLAAGKRILDFGCGDASFIHALLAADCAPLEVIGAEISQALLEDCSRSFSGRTDVRFVHVERLSELVVQTPIDLIVCMEVLEHAVEPESMLDEMYSLLREGGLVIISVPVETGPVLLLKQAVRIAAGRRGIGDYRWTSRYSFAEYWKSMFAGSSQHMLRPVHRPSGSHPHHCHKGFNWRYLQSKIATRFQIRRVFGSPFTGLPPFAGSQVWFVAEKVRKPA